MPPTETDSSAAQSSKVGAPRDPPRAREGLASERLIMTARRSLASLIALAALAACSATSGEGNEPDVDIVEQIGQLSRAELEARDQSGYNALHRAAAAGDDRMATAVLEKGVDVNVRARSLRSGGQYSEHPGNMGGMTALALAANRGSESVVEMLISHSADVDLSDPLVLAASNGHVAVMRQLLNAGAYVDHQSDDMEGATALLAACMMGQAEAVDALLEAKADPSVTNTHGTSPMQAANEYASQSAASPELAAAIADAGGGNHKAVLKSLRRALSNRSKRKRQEEL